MLILKKESYIMFIKKLSNLIKEIKKKSYYNVIILITQYYNL